MHDLQDTLKTVNDLIHKDDDQARQRYQEGSRARLMGILQKKGKTMFIGSIAQFEKFFGGAWGHGRNEEDCTPEQLAVRPLWEACRTEILNNGNNQLRAIEQEVGQYTVSWNRYQTTMLVVDKDKE